MGSRFAHQTRLAIALAVANAVLAIPHACYADHPGAGFGQTISGPIVTISAGTLPAGRWATSMRLEWVRFDALTDQELEDLAGTGEEVHSLDELLAPSLGLAYGVTDYLTIGARLPYVSRRGIREGRVVAGVPLVEERGNSSGIGDLTVLAQCRVTRGEGPRQIALLGGVKAPVGQTHVASPDSELFEVEHEPGTGSWDPLVGIAWSVALPPSSSVDANVLASLATTGARETNLGQLVSANVALSRRVLERDGLFHEESSSGHAHTTLDLVTEVNAEWRAQSSIAGDDDPNSGGTLVYLAPGARFGAEGRWTLSASIGIPIVQDLHGTQHETSVRTVTALGVLF